MVGFMFLAVIKDKQAPKGHDIDLLDCQRRSLIEGYVSTTDCIRIYHNEIYALTYSRGTWWDVYSVKQF